MLFAHQDSGDCDRSIISDISEIGLRHVRVRLVGGDAELLVGVDIIQKLRMAVYFGKRNFQIWKGEWRAMGRNGGIRWVFTLPPAARGYTKSGEYFPKMGISI